MSAIFFNILIWGTMATGSDCQISRTADDVLLKYGDKTFSFPEASTGMKIEKCNLQSDYLLVEVDMGSGGTSSNVREKDLLVFNVKDGKKPVVKENIFSETTTLENGNPVKDTIKRDYSFRKNKKGGSEIQLTNPVKTFPLK